LLLGESPLTLIGENPFPFLFGESPPTHGKRQPVFSEKIPLSLFLRQRAPSPSSSAPLPPQKEPLPLLSGERAYNAGPSHHPGEGGITGAYRRII